MKLFLILALTTALCLAQQTIDRTAAIAAINGLPTLPVDPVAAALQAVQSNDGTTLYADAAASLLVGGKILGIMYTCPRPAAWQANTAYLFGTLVSDAHGNVWRLTLIAAGTTTSGIIPPSGTGTFQDGGYTWTLEWNSATQFICGSSAALP